MNQILKILDKIFCEAKNGNLIMIFKKYHSVSKNIKLNCKTYMNATNATNVLDLTEDYF